MEIIWLVFQGKFRDGANKAFPLETERDIHGNSQAHSPSVFDPDEGWPVGVKQNRKIPSSGNL